MAASLAVSLLPPARTDMPTTVRALVAVVDSSVVLAGRYRLAYRIAAGASGEVWRALDTALDRPVAVKRLRPEYAGHPETLARFRAEALHAGALSHPGIAQVYDYHDAGPLHPPFLVMEVVDGPSLAGALTAGPLGAARTMDVIAQAAAGLAAAHAAGLVHRDIKPANVLLGPDGQVKITDFGIAHAAGSAPLTRAGTVMGTPGYLAPERAAGRQAVPASDLYSLGIVAYECLTGTAPFHGTPLEIAAAHVGQPLPPLPPAVPEAVAALVADLTAKDPADRPASAAEVAERAGLLCGALASGITARLPTAPGLSPAAPAGVAAGPLTGPRLPGRTQSRRRWRAQWRGWWPHWEWPRPWVTLAAALLFAAGMAGAMLGGLSAGPRPSPPAHPPGTVGRPPAKPAGTPARHQPRQNGYGTNGDGG